MTGIETAVPLIVAALAAAGSTTMAVVSWRKASGKVGTSEADVLWQEGANFRTVLLARVATLEAEVAALHQENEKLHGEVEHVKAQNRTLAEDNGRLSSKVQELLEQIRRHGPDIIAHLHLCGGET